ncbi:MAG: rRNA pseudouridine synthase [Synergistaceae bacterium]|nr:rRNA pseudouridine synthase [Synergistaceae bacterium]
MRLNLLLSSNGICSRRKADEIILSGRVQVNNKIVLAPYFRVNESDIISLDGKKISSSPAEIQRVYYIINKPRGYVCAVSDKYDPVIIDLLPKEPRIFPVGRLDKDSEGLLILTNDGNFAQNIIHPSKKISREYEVTLNQPLNDTHLLRWRKGFEIESKFVKPLRIKQLSPEKLIITLSEGIKREIRLMARQMGFRVERLIRVKIGGLELGNLKPGEYESLSFSSLCNKIFSNSRT